MSLFKSNIIKYGAMKYDNECLLLHCSREEYVKAPFDGELTETTDGYILSKKNFRLYITHILPMAKTTHVKTGQVLGVPKIGNKFGVNRAYISVQLYQNNNIEDIIKYIRYKDNSETMQIIADKIAYNTVMTNAAMSKNKKDDEDVVELAKEDLKQNEEEKKEVTIKKSSKKKNYKK